MRTIVDAWFTVDQLDSRYDFRSTFNQPVVFTQEILNQPNLRGYGNLPDLQIAMAKDAQLLALVKSFTQKVSSGDFSSAGEMIRPMLYRWAGVDGVNPSSRGTYVNAQELGFLEKFVGTNFRQSATSQPGPAAGSTLSQTFAQLIAPLSTRLMVQVAPVPIEYNADSDGLVYNGSVTQAQAQFDQLSGGAATSSSEQLTLEASVIANFLIEQKATDASLLVGSAAPDRLVAPSSTTSYRLLGFNGNDTLQGNSGNDSLDGGTGNDTLTGGAGQDTLIGGAGNDALDGGYGIDTLDGGAGDDVLNGSYDSDTLSGGDGNDSLDGGAGNDTLDGGTGNDTLSGGDGIDTLNGGMGNDSLNGGASNDTYRFERGSGQDTIYDDYTSNGIVYNGGTDTLVFGQGIARTDLSWNFNGTDLTFNVAGSTIPDTVKIQNMADVNRRIENFTVAGTPLTLTEVMAAQVWQDQTGRNNLNWQSTAINFEGLAGDDIITTGSYADKLYGGEGNDTLNANGGNDTLDGGVGNDILNGGSEQDTLTGGIGDDTLDGGAGNDTLTVRFV